jgi:hypothetical protein
MTNLERLQELVQIIEQEQIKLPEMDNDLKNWIEEYRSKITKRILSKYEDTITRTDEEL